MSSEIKSPDVLTCPIEHVNTFAPEFLQDPYPFYERMRNEAPVYRDPNSGIVFISTDEYIREANWFRKYN
jgi:cytochrome P450